ncbi:DnaA ATPase domain-containing protein [Paenibacillus silvae]|uniref:DnaA ATPase domain-containing protein n=1 Tax=Paenibacillus silvae TaxID=1325358 RepID=UPI001E2D52E2|nr:DnaA/Hda family protein [Paenibacillus silvae]
MLARIERLRSQQNTSELQEVGRSLFPTTLNSNSATSNEGCPKCKYTGTITDLRWVEDDEYKKPDGTPMKREVTTVKLCDCFYERQFQNYNPRDGLAPDEKEYTFKTAVIDKENETQLKLAMDFVRNIKDHMEKGSWMYIFGDDLRAQEKNVSAFGTGKTYLMVCIANALAHRKIPGIYVTEDDLFGAIKETYGKKADESESEVLKRFRQVPILMIDDIFTAQYKDWAEDKLFSILNGREREGKVTIMTSNYELERIPSQLPINGAKLVSRIKGRIGEREIEMIGRDRRPEQHNQSA